MKKHSIWLRSLTALFFTVLAVALILAACGNKFAISWQIAENATVSVEGYDKLPTNVADGTELVFKAEGVNGYQVDSVMINGRRVSAKSDGKYSLTVTGDTEIEVTVTPAIAAVRLTKTPDKTFYAGEEVDASELEVTVDYLPEDVESKITSSFSVIYEHGSAFAIGDTSYKVRVSGVDSEPVTIPAVEAKITINPVGGTISEELINAWRSNSDLHNFTISSVEQGTGIISFTFTSLSETILLPTAEQIVLGDGASAKFINWVDEDKQTYTRIPTTQTVSLNFYANWELILVDMEKIELVLENGTPYLAMTLIANTDFSAYLYFSEGNAKYRLEGDTINAPAGVSTVAKFDLTKLSSYVDENGSSFAGAWMDIRVNTEINGVSFSQSFPIDPSNPVAKVGQMIHDANWNYRLFTYDNNGVHDLKVCFRKFVYNYEVEVAEIGGKATLIFKGILNTAIDSSFAYEGADVKIEMGSYFATGKVKADGSWSATLDLSTITNNVDLLAGDITVTASNGASLDVRTSADDGTTTKTKLDLTGCSTLFDFYPSGASPRWYANEVIIGDYRYTLGVDWNEIWLNITDCAREIVVKGVTLAEKNGVAYLVIEGVYGHAFTAEEFLALIKTWNLDLQNNEQAGGGNWDMIAIPEGGTIYEAANGKFTIYVSLANVKAGYLAFAHFGTDVTTNLTCANVYGDPIVVNGIRYSIGIWTGWGSNLALVEVVDAANEIKVTGATIEAKDGVVYLVIEGIYGYGYTADQFLALIKTWNLDLQNNASDGGGNWDMIDVPEGGIIYNAANGEFRIYVSLANAQVGNAVFSHFGTDKTINLTCANIHWEPITLNGKSYRMGIFTGWGSDLVTVYVEEA